MSLRLLFMLLYAPSACVAGLTKPFWGLLALVAMYYFRPDVWGAPSWFRPVMCAPDLPHHKILPLERSEQPMQVVVRDNNVDQALRALKKKLQREGVYREMKLRRFFEKPSEKKARDQAAAVRRARKLERKRLERDGAFQKRR